MATCPECEADIDIDEDDVDKGDVITCRECGSSLEVISLTPLEFDAAPEDNEDEPDEGDDEDALDEEDEEDEGWDE